MLDAFPQEDGSAAPQILALGEPMVEFNCTGDGGGRLYLQGFGGDTSNFAIAAARQGAHVGMLSALGNDANGRMLRALWDAEGVDHRQVRSDVAAHTGIYFVSHCERCPGFSFFRQVSAAGRIRPADLPRAASQLKITVQVLTLLPIVMTTV